MCDRPPTTYADRIFGNDQRGGQLLALEFVRRMFDFVEDPIDTFCIVAGGNDLGG